MTKILLVEDDRAIISNLSEYLTGEGFTVDAVTGQTEAEYKIDRDPPDLLLLDVSLAEGSGFEVCRYAKQKDLPVIFLTASGEENSVVRGLDMGADDYIGKPFRPKELVSRIKSVLRRCKGVPGAVLLPCGLSVDPEKGSVKKNGAELALTALEYRLLTLFLNNRGVLLTRNRLLEDIWDAGGDFVNDNTLTVYIKRLREKTEDDPQNPQIIKTVRGVGYRMD